MKTGLKTLDNAAFTIVEVMIVLAVTGAMLIAGLSAINGQQQRTEFSQSINDIQAQINDVINNVSNGYYAKLNNFTCEKDTNGPKLTTSGGADTQGANGDCIFLGRAIQFGISGNTDRYNIFNIVGLRQTTGPTGVSSEVEKLSEAKPKLLAPGNSPPANFPNATLNQSLLYGVTPVKMTYRDTDVSGNTPQDIGAVAFVSTLAHYNDKNVLESGSQTTNLMPLSGTSLGQSPTAAVDATNTFLNSLNPVTNPTGGVTICFKSGGTGQYGVITIGSNGRQPSTKLEIFASLAQAGGACSS